MLSAADEEEGGQCDEATARHWLTAKGMPVSERFVDYLTQYAGLEFDVASEHRRRRHRFLSIENGIWASSNRSTQEWQLPIGGVKDDIESPLYMRPDGQLLIEFGQRNVRQYSSIEFYIEDLALYDQLDAQEYCIDGLVITQPHAGRMLADKYGLPVVREATDEFLQWWQSDELTIRTTECVHHTGQYYGLLLAWPHDNTETEALMVEELLSLVEPRWRAHIPSEERRHYRRTGELVRVEVPPPTHSFREFSREGLYRLSVAGIIAQGPPGDETGFHEYLTRVYPLWQSHNNAIAMYYAAVGLVSFGHKEHLATVIRYAPRDQHAYWPEPMWACKYLRTTMLGWPYCPLEDSDKALEWVCGAQDDIEWDPETERFRFTGIFDHSTFAAKV